MSVYQERQHGQTLEGLANKIWWVAYSRRAGHRNNMCFIDYGSGGGIFLSKIAELTPGNHNRFIGIENDPHTVAISRSTPLHDNRIVIFEHSLSTT